ncbi:MAG: hypothetical protein ACM3TR_19950 [Caulobacteraceae bacterium]
MSVTAEVDKLYFEYEGNVGYTILQNIFIERYLPSASGNDVKVYLVGLKRCFGSKNCQWASNKTIAEDAGVSIRAVQRAWKYWESVCLVHIIPRFVQDVKKPSDYRTERTGTYRIPLTNVIRFTNLQELTFQEAFRRGQASIKNDSIPHDKIDGTPHDKIDLRINTTLNNYKEEERQDDVSNVNVVSDLLNTQPQNKVSEEDLQSVSTLYANLTKKTKLGKADMSHLARLIGQYGVEDVSEALEETARSERSKGSYLRYTEGILTNWTKEGKRITDSSPRPSKSKHSLSKESTARRDPEEAKYYADYLKLEQALFDSQPIEEEPQEDLVSSSIQTQEDDFKTNMAKMRKALKLA